MALAFRDIGLDLTPVQLSPDGKTARVTSVVNIDLTNAEREARPEGSRVVNIDYVYKATRDKTHNASFLQVQMTIKRGGAAQTVTPARTVTQLDNPVFVGGDIPLEGLPPGLYTLEAAITNNRSRATRTVVSPPFRIAK